MKPILIAAVFFSLPALAQSVDCRAVRRTLELARDGALDTEVIATLEREVCSHSKGGLTFTSTGSTECTDITALWTLAKLASASVDTMDVLETQRAVSCELGSAGAGRLTWPGGETMRTGSGTLYWPNGKAARTATGLWYYPSGTAVRSAAGALFYPDGSSARSTSGRWYFANGRAADERELTVAACAKAAAVCQSWLDYVKSTTGNARDFAMLSLGWMAR
jgi:hypothetical protein